MQNKITIFGVLLAIIFWLVNAFIDSIFSIEGTTYLESVFHPSGEKLWMRTFVVLLFLIFSAYTERLLEKIHKMTIELKSYHERLQQMLAELEMENTERKHAVEELERLSETDPLTSVYNRRKFNDILASEVERSKRYSTGLSIIMCDIDHFKKINDQFGHDVGDNALKVFSSTINNNIREVDMFARWGGEEFMILMPNTNAEVAKAVAEKLRQIVEDTEIKKVNTFTASFGVADLNQEDTAESLLKRVDEALYKAKNSGRNKVEISE